MVCASGWLSVRCLVRYGVRYRADASILMMLCDDLCGLCEQTKMQLTPRENPTIVSAIGTIWRVRPSPPFVT